jgi:phytoene synthase
MTAAQPKTWEQTLLMRAQEAWHAVVAVSPRSLTDRDLLDRAYAHCDSITATHSRSFYLATRPLAADKRRAVRALYAFCRVSDDIVDCLPNDVERILAAWRARVLAPEPLESDLVAVAWADTRQRYGIPFRYAEQLMDGVARDLHQTRYDTFAELATYVYGVASTVGLMSMHIIGFAGPEAIPYAIKLGVALQLTNILRDVREDWNAGRVYLPAQEFAWFGLTGADLQPERSMVAGAPSCASKSIEIVACTMNPGPASRC